MSVAEMAPPKAVMENWKPDVVVNIRPRKVDLFGHRRTVYQDYLKHLKMQEKKLKGANDLLTAISVCNKYPPKYKIVQPMDGKLSAEVAALAASQCKPSFRVT